MTWCDFPMNGNYHEPSVDWLVATIKNQIEKNNNLYQYLKDNKDRFNNTDYLYLDSLRKKGMTDDDLFELALNTIEPHGTIFVPNKTYNITKDIIINKPVTIAGNYTGWDNQENNGVVNTDVYNGTTLVLNNCSIIICSIGVQVSNLSIKVIDNTAIKLDFSYVSSNTNIFRFIKLYNIDIFCTGTSNGLEIVNSIIDSLFCNIHLFNPTIGFNVKNENTNGTSLTFINCWSQNCIDTGFKLNNLYYSTFINCGTDGTTQQKTKCSFDIDNCNTITFISCWGEILSREAFNIYASNMISIIGCIFVTVQDNSSGDVGAILAQYADGLTVKNTRMINTKANVRALDLSHTAYFSTENCDFNYIVKDGVLTQINGYGCKNVNAVQNISSPETTGMADFEGRVYQNGDGCWCSFQFSVTQEITGNFVLTLPVKSCSTAIHISGDLRADLSPDSEYVTVYALNPLTSGKVYGMEFKIEKAL